VSDIKVGSAGNGNCAKRGKATHRTPAFAGFSQSLEKNLQTLEKGSVNLYGLWQ